MRYASVVVDIPTRGLDRAFDYAVPDALAAHVEVGATVLVPFSGRAVVGYVVSLAQEPPAGVPAEKILPIKQVLASSAFDAAGARVALWMAEEYACPLATALHPFLAPGQRT
ncbi:MAG: primosomal protein N', partial [Olegusella sp.]|nr:primosomal protein N' [Olegusella sp.]